MKYVGDENARENTKKIKHKLQLQWLDYFSENRVCKWMI